ncbi:energy-coupled thiamine transporter ThiT [Anaerosphaera multitolerans]|uniref:Energy-coupled thiamine transporter ThiT n=1 Tax=Anaerosphaera multitolerans TaxID=2487351 RepID=A0A437S6Z9_9FIRM|nr:energy-coupled thiamine transporter ThiT [Anaerosphaera multitolerans]RVU54728.1 energy-coupled thiamine transporter ThiT [Anaerosphaera multitolerans]
MKNNTKMITEAGAMIALAQVLSYIKLFQLPQGGSITFGSMVPIILFASYWGGKYGLIAAFTYGFMQFIFGGFVLNPMSILLDYILAFGILGIVGFFPKTLKGVLTGSTIAIIFRFLCHFLSGWLIFWFYAPDNIAPWLYSLQYNSFVLVELIITLVIITTIYKPYMNFKNTSK